MSAQLISESATPGSLAGAEHVQVSLPALENHTIARQACSIGIGGNVCHRNSICSIETSPIAARGRAAQLRRGLVRARPPQVHEHAAHCCDLRELIASCPQRGVRVPLPTVRHRLRRAQLRGERGAGEVWES
jgi:hypothetical protein